jgi:5-methylcytosine-specific restriction protein A
MQTLADLKPRRKGLVFDLVEEAGLDMTGWRESSNDPRGPKANPKYCYEWAFIEPGKFIILNLWHGDMVEEDGRIVERNNCRAIAEFHRTVSLNPTSVVRAERFDNAIQTASRENLPVRVIINDGVRRDRGVPNSKPSRVTGRILDPEPWTITTYDWTTGKFKLTRGILAAPYVDQFDLDQAEKSSPERRKMASSAFVRDPEVRRRVLRRASGHCELCGKKGFTMEIGALYLETHHVVPLADGGADNDRNVVALCADDHRRAHFSADRAAIAERLLIVARVRRE